MSETHLSPLLTHPTKVAPLKSAFSTVGELFLVEHELLLTAAQTEQLHVLSLEEGDTEWKVDAHNPELKRARELPVDGVNQEDDAEVDMNHHQGGDDKSRVSNADKGQVAVVVKETATGQEEDGPEHADEDVENAQDIEVGR